MKNSLLITAFLLLSLGAEAVTGPESNSYVRTQDHLYFGQDLKIGLFNSKIISSDRTVTRIPNREVVAYMHNSHLFEYLPVICETGETLCYAMMEYITTRSGLRLYRYDECTGKDIHSCYFIFKDGMYYLRVDPRNALTVLPFFGINNVKLGEN